MKQSILVAGIGNVFFGDDAFGVEVARRLAQWPLPSCVKVADFGIRGFDLAHSLLDGYDLVILVDAARRGVAPGTLQVIEPDLNGSGPGFPEASLPQAHGMVPTRAIEMAKALGAKLKMVRVVCCEPASLGGEGEEFCGLSEPVSA